MIDVNLAFEVAPQKEIWRCQIGRPRWPGDIVKFRYEMFRKHLTQRSDCGRRCMGWSVVSINDGSYRAMLSDFLASQVHELGMESRYFQQDDARCSESQDAERNCQHFCRNTALRYEKCPKSSLSLH